MAQAAERGASQRAEERIDVGPPSRRFPRLPRLLHAVFVYSLLILASLFILLPVGWMLTAALKPDTAPVFTFPPEWFPTRYWNLYWGSDGAPIRVQPLAQDRLGFAPGSKAQDLIYPDVMQPYERLVEGAFVVYRDGYYYLFYSGDDCCSAAPGYAVMVARSRSATGLFEKRSETTGVWGANVILRQNDRWEGTGHNSVVRDEAGRDWIFYHAIDPDDRYNPGTEAPKRPMLMEPIMYRSGWPKIEARSPSTGERQGPQVR